jgi:hypothetical protein
MIVHHNLFDELQKDFIFDDVVLPRIIDYQCRFSFEHICQLLLLTVVTVPDRLHDRVYQLCFALCRVLVLADF